MSNIYIAGVGMTKFGRHIERTLESLTGEAIEKALADATDLELTDLAAVLG